MKACVDVYYTDDTAIAAALVFDNWADIDSVEECVHVVGDVQPYVPGQFFKRRSWP